MKRLGAFMLACMLLTLAPCALAAQEYTVAEKLAKQLWAGSGFSGVLTVELAAQEGKAGLETLKPIVLDVDYIYVRPTEEESDEHRLDISLVEDEQVKSAAALQYKDEALSLRADLLGEGWYTLDAGKAAQGAALETALSGAAAYTGVPSLAQSAAVIALLMEATEGAEEWISPYTTRMDIWIEGYRQDTVLGKLEDGTSTMQISYQIPPTAIRAQAKQLIYELLSDDTALAVLTDALGEEAAQLYLSPALQEWYFSAVDALPIAEPLSISRTVSLKGDTLSLQISLPLYDAQVGQATLAYTRTQGEGDLPDDHVIRLTAAERSLTLTYQAYSSITGVNVTQGVLESAAADGFTVQEDDAAQDWAVSFTMKRAESTSKDLEGRDVYAFDFDLSLAPYGEGEPILSETEISLNARFASKELKSAATELQATLTLSGESTVAQLTFEGTSRKKWEPEAILGARVSLGALSEAEKATLLTGAGARALALLAEYTAQ